jgi:hypothetical protein
MKRLIAAVAALSIGCTSGESTSPKLGEGDGETVTILVDFDVVTGGTVSATLNGVAYTAEPGFISVPSGTREISGTFTGATFKVSFGGFTDQGGVEFESVSSEAGPSPVVTRCSVAYTRSGTGQQAFRVKFKVVTKVGDHC